MDKSEAVFVGSVAVPAEAERVREVRRWLREVLGDDHPVAYEAGLLGSEVFTNALLHSDSGRPDEGGRPGAVSVTVLAGDGVVRIEFTDAGSDTSVPRLAGSDGGCPGPVVSGGLGLDVTDAGAPGPDVPDVRAVSGRGLLILREMTGGRCGTYADGAGRTVWFELVHGRQGGERS